MKVSEFVNRDWYGIVVSAAGASKHEIVSRRGLVVNGVPRSWLNAISRMSPGSSTTHSDSAQGVIERFPLVVLSQPAENN